MSDRPSPHRRLKRALLELPWLALSLAAGAVILGGVALVYPPGTSSGPSRYTISSRPVFAPPGAEADNAELARCRAQTDQDDPRCRELWEEQRRRFLGS